MRTRVFVIQKPARVLLAQGDGLVQRVVRKRGQRHGVGCLVLRVQRIGLQHVVVAVHVPVFGDDNPFARAPRHGAPRIRRSTTGHVPLIHVFYPRHANQFFLFFFSIVSRFPQNVIPQFVPNQKKLNPILKCYLHDRDSFTRRRTTNRPEQCTPLHLPATNPPTAMKSSAVASIKWETT
jgi:hypothetical protein